MHLVIFYYKNCCVSTFKDKDTVTGDVENKNKTLVGNPEEKRLFGKLRYIQVNNKKVYRKLYRLCGLVVRVSGYRYRGSGFDSRRYQIF